MENVLRKKEFSSSFLGSWLVIFVGLVLLLGLGVGAAANHSGGHARCYSRQTSFRVFWQDFFNVTDFIVLKGLRVGNQNISATTAPIGTTAYFEDFLTEGPQPSSRVLGSLIGSLLVVSVNGKTNLVSMSLTFNTTYNGTLSLVGPLLAASTSTLPIVGGTGDFLLSQGQVVFTPVNITFYHAAYSVDISIYQP